MTKQRILFIVLHRPDRSPGQRYRFEQYLDLLKLRDVEYDISYLLNAKDDIVYYSRGRYWRKFLIVLKSAFKRIRDVISADKYDTIFIYREAFYFGNTLFEYLFKRSRARIIFDFDDAIWLKDVSEGNKVLGWMKNPAKIKRIISYSDLVFAGNKYLAQYALKYNSNVVILPSTINTESYTYRPRRKDNYPICIGWTGSQTTIKHFTTILIVLKILKRKFADKIYFKVIGDSNYRNAALGIKGITWDSETETTDLEELDIGIMPLPKDKWTLGKCGMKGLQYMALGIPSVLSPVGVNESIIEDNVNGFLAESEQEWVDKLSKLIEDQNLRLRIGENARQTVVKNYSVKANADKFISNVLVRNML